MLEIALWKRLTILLVCLVGLSLALPNVFYTRAERHNDAVTAIERGAVTSDALQVELDQWPGVLPSSVVNLGLDLRGGAHLLGPARRDRRDPTRG
jgi:preprotein translocase subunit SecD